MRVGVFDSKQTTIALGLIIVFVLISATVFFDSPLRPGSSPLRRVAAALAVLDPRDIAATVSFDNSNFSASIGVSPSHLPKHPRVVTVTRFWGKVAEDAERLRRFVEIAAQYSSVIIVCHRVEADAANAVPTAVASLPPPLRFKVRILPVVPWGVYSTALNAGLLASLAPPHPADVVVFQSVEVSVTLAAARCAIDNLWVDPLRIVVGLELPAAHAFGPAGAALAGRGRAFPWNTFAAWRARALGLVGFPPLADGVVGGGVGMEEVPAFMLAAAAIGVNPAAHPAAVLLRAPNGSVEWGVATAVRGDAARAAWHADKLATKDGIAARQAAALKALKPPLVWHDVCVGS